MLRRETLRRIAYGPLLAAALLMAWSPLAASAQTITTIDAPGAITSGDPSGTHPVAINLSGTVAGYFYGPSSSPGGGVHGFLRDPVTTTITPFNPPADTTNSTYVLGINNSDVVVGHYNNGLNQVGFMRDSLGNFTDINPPDSIHTEADSINNLGQVAGIWYDSLNMEHGFVWDSASNAYTSFDIPGSTTILVSTINNKGEVAGTYFDASLKPHGYLLDAKAKGRITTFDALVTDTYVYSMNDKEEITGIYSTDNSVTLHGFVRKENGAKEASFDADPTAVQTVPRSINTYGTIVGEWQPADGRSSSGFVRNPPKGLITGSGTFTSFTVPGAEYTQPKGVNDNGAICGSYVIFISAGTYSYHGFIRQ